MPIYKADLSDGTTVEIESDHEPTDQEILSAVEKSKPSFLGAAARSFGTSVGPTGAGMAAAAPFMGPAMEAAIPTYGASLLLPVGAGLAGAWAWEKAQKPVLKKAFPGLEAQQERDVQEQKIGSALGRIAAVAPFAEFSPLQSAKALAEIPAAMRGAPEAIKDVAGLGLNIGLQEGIVTAQSLASGQGLPSKAEVGEAAIMGGAFGKLRGPLGKLAGEPSTKPERSAVTPEEQKVREEALKQKYESEGRKAEIVPGKLARNENAVAQTLKDGTVQISRPNLHEQLEQHLLAGKSIDEALDSIVSEESIHGATRTLPGGDEMAAEFYRAMTPLEKWIERRRYHGPRYKGETLSDSDYGSEAIRFQLQMATKMTPGEYLFYRENTVMSNKLLTKLEDIVRWIRETLGTKASKRQLEILGKVEENLAADRKGAKDAQRVREDKGQPAQAGQVAQEGQGDSGQNVEQATPGQPKPVGEGVPVPLNQRFPVGAKVKYTPPGALDPKKSESGTVVGHKTDPTTGQIFAEVELKGGRREFVGDVNNIRPAKKAKAPPAAQPVGAQPGQAPVGAAKAGAAPTAPAPAATPIISTTPAEVQNPRLAELRKLWADRPPTAEEAQEHRELTRESRERAIAQAKARRAGETGPAMPLGGERGEETERRIKAIAYSAGDAYTPEEALTVAHNFADWLQDKPPETWDAYLEKFSERIAEKRNAEAANIVATNVTPQDQEVERIRKQLIAEFEATTGGKVIDLPPPPATTWNFLYTGMLRHLGRPATPRQAKGEAAPSQIKTEKLPKNSMGLTVPQNLAKRIYYDFGDYASYWRAIHRQDPTIPEDYVRQAWSEAVNDYLQNASRDQIMDLLKAHGEDLEHGRFRGFMGDVDATEILRPLDRGYLIQDPKEFQKFRDLNVQGDNPTTGQPYTEQEADAKAAEILFREKDEALFRLDRYAAAKGVTPGEAIKMLRQQIHSELADANEFLELHRGGKQKVVSKEGKLAFLEAKRGRTMSLKEAQKAYRQSLDKAMDRRRRAIDYLSERLIKPSRRPDLDPARPKLSLDDIRTVWTLTPEQAADITFLRGQIWQGTGVKGVAPSKLTRGVVLLKNRITKQMDAVSLYLHPTKKEVYVYNPRFLPGDKTQQHIPIKSVLGTWDITKMFLLESPVNKFHQRWKTEEAFMGEIGDNATIKEVLADSVWEMGQKKRDAKAAISALEKLLEGPTKEEEVTGELPKEAGEEGEAKVEGAEAKAATTEAEGMRPSEAGLVEDEQAAPEERAIEMKSGSPETLAEGSGHLQGPGMGVLGLYQTDPQRLVRGPLTTEEAEAISQAISNYEKGTHQIPIIKQAASKKRGHHLEGIRPQDPEGDYQPIGSPERLEAGTVPANPHRLVHRQAQGPARGGLLLCHRDGQDRYLVAKPVEEAEQEVHTIASPERTEGLPGRPEPRSAHGGAEPCL